MRCYLSAIINRKRPSVRRIRKTLSIQYKVDFDDTRMRKMRTVDKQNTNEGVRTYEDKQRQKASEHMKTSNDRQDM
jgi:hypothetical protein